MPAQTVCESPEFKTLVKNIREILASAIVDFERVQEILCAPEDRTLIDCIESLKSIEEYACINEDWFRKYDCPRAIFAGPMGKGKSATQNSLLDDPNLLRESKFGRGTWKMTETTYCQETQTKPYRWSFDFATPETITAKIKRNLQWIYRFHGEAQDVPSVQDEPESDEHDARSRYHTALDYFIGLFSGCRSDLQNKSGAERFFRTAHAQNNDGILHHLIEDALKVRASLLPEMVEATSSKGLHDIRAKFPCACEKLQTADKIFLQNKVLENLTLCDIPGLTDDNPDIVETARSCIARGDYLMLVFEAKRIIDEGALERELCAHLQQFPPERVSIVVTHTFHETDHEKLAVIDPRAFTR